MPDHLAFIFIDLSPTVFEGRGQKASLEAADQQNWFLFLGLKLTFKFDLCHASLSWPEINVFKRYLDFSFDLVVPFHI